MQQNEAYKIYNREAFLKLVRLEGFFVDGNHVIYPLKHKPMTCNIDATYAGEIIDKYLVVNTSFKKESCRFCRRAISKLQRLAREFEN